MWHTKVYESLFYVVLVRHVIDESNQLRSVRVHVDVYGTFQCNWVDK